ncbi:MAG: hypothetical protein JXB49_00455 [Bacteroidales bacterium]|nr:hypothetical protein [Bacteroidales bacterium]
MTDRKIHLKAFGSIILYFCMITSVAGQEREYKTYRDSDHGFSFNIPDSWVILKEDADDFFIGTCKPTNEEEIAIYDDCYEGIIFRVMFYSTDLTTTLEEDGQYIKTGDTYTTYDRANNTVKVENIKGQNWTGVYHFNECGLLCKTSGPKPIGGQCEFFYFSNGKKTICITTNGFQLEDNVRKILLQSFKFE